VQIIGWLQVAAFAQSDFEQTVFAQTVFAQTRGRVQYRRTVNGLGKLARIEV
jgi:hypothetical protein